MKPRYTMQMAYEAAAAMFRFRGNYHPSHCDVRCAINDLLDQMQKYNHTVHHGYSQDKAHREVLKLLKK